MQSTEFKAMVVKEVKGNYIRNIETRNIRDLPAGEVLVRVKFSSLNYKDALSVSGNKGITRVYPHTPGIDAAGFVEESSVDKFKNGDEVIITGFDLGMNTAGGFGQYIRVPQDWIIGLPANITLRESMILGTAGFTSALAVKKLEQNGAQPGSGDILVTGASGGVGSISVALLSKLGYRVVASTGKKDKHEFLKSLGAQRVIGREEINDISGKALLPPRWGGVIDTVGGTILTTAVRSAKYNCSVAACGLVQTFDISHTVFPFILRGVNLLGIDSVHCDPKIRNEIWTDLSGRWKLDSLNEIATEITLEELDNYIESMLLGKISGRIVVKHE